MITVGFSSADTLVSWLIRRATGSRVSHCFVVREVLGVECALEAVASGFRAIPMSVFSEGNKIVDIVSVDCDPSLDEPILGTMLGHPYDFLGLLGFLVVLLGRKLGRHWRNPVRGSGRLFCSESVVRLLSAVGVPGAADLDPEMCSPEDVLVFLKNTRGSV